MIIRALHIENLFQYQGVSLTDLPAAGYILLTGGNESGKSTIIAALTLALFGRTATLRADQLGKAVRWGEARGSVTVEFLADNGEAYTIARDIERDGTCQARLQRAGKELHAGVAEVDQAMFALTGLTFELFTATLYLPQGGAEKAIPATILHTLAGNDRLQGAAWQLAAEEAVQQERLRQQQEAIEALQAEWIAPDALAQAMAQLQTEYQTVEAGIKAVAQQQQHRLLLTDAMQQAAVTVNNVLERLLRCDRDSTLQAWLERSKAVEQAVQELLDTGRQAAAAIEEMPGHPLRAAMETLRKRLHRLMLIVEEVANQRYQLALWLGEIPAAPGATDTLRQQRKPLLETLEQENTRRWFFRVWNGFGLLLVLLFCGLLALVLQQGEGSLQQAVQSLFRLVYPAWQEQMLLPALAAGVLSGLLLTVIGWRGLRGVGRQRTASEAALQALAEQAERYKERIQQLDGAASQPLPQQVNTLLALAEGAPWQEILHRWAEEDGADLLHENGLARFISGLQEQQATFQRRLAEYLAEQEAKQLAGERQQQAYRVQLEQLTVAMDQQRQQQQQDQQRRQQVAALQKEQQAEQHQLAVHQLAHTLLLGSCRESTARFHQELRRSVAHAVPLFTQGRYHHVRIDEQLQMAAFSTIKNDFIGDEEISGAVRQQLHLALRMALNQALLTRIGEGPHCLILDEPFTHFDHQRLRAAWESLSQMNPSLAQLWIIVQGCEEAMAATANVKVSCAADQPFLTVRGGH
ncbi:MAG: AAA family ATPase [Magnetococcales bacterium]|nr:AAA family ATPase [Magnetococcales bacterium]